MTRDNGAADQPRRSVLAIVDGIDETALRRTVMPSGWASSTGQPPSETCLSGPGEHGPGPAGWGPAAGARAA